jgi:hypothetical protein
MQSRGKLAVNSRQYLLERRGKLRSKIAANSQQKRGKIMTRQTRGKIFFSLRQILPQIYDEILLRICRDAAKSRQFFAENVRLICCAGEKKFRGKQPIPL